jgi:hypothetical protein
VGGEYIRQHARGPEAKMEVVERSVA